MNLGKLENRWKKQKGIQAALHPPYRETKNKARDSFIFFSLKNWKMCILSHAISHLPLKLAAKDLQTIIALRQIIVIIINLCLFISFFFSPDVTTRPKENAMSHIKI